MCNLLLRHQCYLAIVAEIYVIMTSQNMWEIIRQPFGDDQSMNMYSQFKSQLGMSTTSLTRAYTLCEYTVIYFTYFLTLVTIHVSSLTFFLKVLLQAASLLLDQSFQPQARELVLFFSQLLVLFLATLLTESTGIRFSYEN